MSQKMISGIFMTYLYDLLNLLAVLAIYFLMSLLLVYVCHRQDKQVALCQSSLSSGRNVLAAPSAAPWSITLGMSRAID